MFADLGTKVTYLKRVMIGKLDLDIECGKYKKLNIKHKRYVEYTSLYKENEIKIQNLLDEANDIRKQLKASKPFYRFWHTESEKIMLSTIKNLSMKAYELEENNQEIKSKRFFEVHECRRKIEELLRRNCFVLTHTSSAGEDCVTKTDIWTLEEYEV